MNNIMKICDNTFECCLYLLVESVCYKKNVFSSSHNTCMYVLHYKHMNVYVDVFNIKIFNTHKTKLNFIPLTVGLITKEVRKENDNVDVLQCTHLLWAFHP